MRNDPLICHNFLMCGRYRLSRRKQVVEEYFDASGEDDRNPRYNLAPTQPVPIIRQHPKDHVRQISLMRWGLIPYWSKDSAVAASRPAAGSWHIAHRSAAQPAMRPRSGTGDAPRWSAAASDGCIQPSRLSQRLAKSGQPR